MGSSPIITVTNTGDSDLNAPVLDLVLPRGQAVVVDEDQAAALWGRAELVIAGWTPTADAPAPPPAIDAEPQPSGIPDGPPPQD